MRRDDGDGSGPSWPLRELRESARCARLRLFPAFRASNRSRFGLCVALLALVASACAEAPKPDPDAPSTSPGSSGPVVVVSPGSPQDSGGTTGMDWAWGTTSSTTSYTYTWAWCGNSGDTAEPELPTGVPPIDSGDSVHSGD
jgi:hypothetical protein